MLWAEHPTPETWPSVELSRDGRWVLVTAMVGWSRYDLHLLDRATGEWRALVEGVDAITSLTFGDDALYGTTMIDAPRGRLVRVPLDPVPAGPAGWDTVVPERDVVLGGVAIGADGLLVTATRRAVDHLERWSFDGRTGGPIGDLGVVAVAGLTADRSSGRAFTIVTGFDRPATLVDLSAPLGQVATTEAIPALVVDEIDVISPDGTVIGAFVVRSAGTGVGPDTPTILTGYGGFAISETPVWSPMAAAWCEAGGQWVVAGLRGGFEHGESWHLAGNRGNKQRVFDDFHAVADHLVATGRTSRDRLAVVGGSNGGLLVGAALTQRPDLCRAVWCAVPLLDMVRFPQFLIARLWTDEYGDPDVAEEFAWLHAYSPYHRVVEGARYPGRTTGAAAAGGASGPRRRQARGQAGERGRRCAGVPLVAAGGAVVTARVEWLTVAGDPDRWRALGLTVTADGLVPLFGTSLRVGSRDWGVSDGHPPITKTEGGGVVGWGISGMVGGSAVTSIDGLVTEAVDAMRPVYADHELGAIGLDHVVVLTGRLERTSDAIAAATGCELRRVRELGTMRQGFHRIGAGGLIVEIVERGELGDDPARFWGIVLNVEDLDAACARLGDELIGAPKDAVQPGRRIATVRDAAGLGLPVALMTPG